jgi:uncharacterized protein (DUF488 family)
MGNRSADLPDLVLTIGHSARPLDEFLRILQAHGVTLLADVRKMPRSRRNPQFNRDTLPEALRTVGIGYLEMPGLGGLRKPRPDSPNTGWRNASFQGYADYMQTPAFVESLNALIERAKGERVVLMCAEAVPWRCHRSLIADALLVRGVPVEDVYDEVRRKPHVVTPWAHVDGTGITYPPVEGDESAGDLFRSRTTKSDKD